MFLSRKKIGKLKECLPYFIVKNHIAEYDFSNLRDTMNSMPPHVFNEQGDEMKVFFLKDAGNSPYSLSMGRYPRRILWDRFNRSLETHFYVHENILNETYNCTRKFGILRESEVIIPNVYREILKRHDILKNFSCIFTSSEMILNKYENARFAPANSVWYGTKICGGELSDRSYENKNRNISIIASNKSMCKLHVLRAQLANYYKGSEKVDCYGRSVGRFIKKKAEALEGYRYSIVIENNVTPYYFTEKVLDCFAAMTVPIYIGATEIGRFFNSDGIICVNESALSDFSKIDKIIERCSERDYDSRINAIKDNYMRVQDYLCYEDYLVDHYDL